MKSIGILGACGYLLLFSAFMTGCASTTIVESPKTVFVPEGTVTKSPELIWTSRTLAQKFDYLGEVHVQSWSYDGALERLTDAGRQLRADALIDVHYEQVGFLTKLQAFAIKYK